MTTQISESIKIQLLALGYITRYKEEREGKNGQRVVDILGLTEKGERLMFQLNAIKRKTISNNA